VLAAAGLRRPDTGDPLSEALVFGIAGGLGALYILWEWEAHNVRVLVLGFHHLGNYPVRYFQGLADRLNVRVSVPETGSRWVATESLDGALALRERQAVTGSPSTPDDVTRERKSTRTCSDDGGDAERTEG